MNRNIVNSVIIVIALVSVGYFVVSQKTSQKLFPTTSTQTSTSVSPLLTTERWIGLDGYPGGISLRTAAGSNTDLLLKHNNAEIVYGYSPADKQLRSVNVDTWNNAAGEVIDCNRQVEKEPWRIRIDRETNRLLVDGKEVNGINGKVHLRYQFTSKGDKFAVLSANGRKTSSLLPFLGEGGASGTHHSQVFSYPGLVPTGSAVELPFTTERINFRSCWSSDERFIVYSDATDSQLSIVVVR
jgi:hypothetical protein